MNTWVVLATGPSMSQEVADSVRGRCGVIAVSDAYRLAPWADVLVSSDSAWWRAHPAALKFPGRKFCGVPFKDLEQIPYAHHITNGSNTGLRAMALARDLFNAELIIMLGFDGHGAHFFGKHPHPLKNATPKKMENHVRQFRTFRGCKVFNCTPGSAIDCFQFATLEEVLA